MDNSKTIYLLIGPKGSGKSFIGTLFHSHFHIPFVRVEDWAKRVKRERGVWDEAYVKEVFLTIQAGILQELETVSALVFESTGLTQHFDNMLSHLRSLHQVVLIRIWADPDLCLSRVRTRDASIHINVSDDQVLEINRQVAAKSHPFDFEIHNSHKSQEELVKEIRRILNR